MDSSLLRRSRNSRLGSDRWYGLTGFTSVFLLTPKFICWRKGLWGVIISWKERDKPSWLGLVPLIKRDPTELPSSSTMWYSHQQTRKQALTRHRIYRLLDLGLPSLQNGEKSVFGIEATPPVAFCCSSLNWLRQLGSWAWTWGRLQKLESVP